MELLNLIINGYDLQGEKNMDAWREAKTVIDMLKRNVEDFPRQECYISSSHGKDRQEGSQGTDETAVFTAIRGQGGKENDKKAFSG